MEKCNSNKSLSRWRDKNPIIDTSQRRYRYHIETTIKIPPTVRKEKKVYIYQHPRTWEGTNSIQNIFSHLATKFSFHYLRYLTLSSEALWQAPHRWPIHLSTFIHSCRIFGSPGWCPLNDHYDCQFQHHQFGTVYGERLSLHLGSRV